MTIDLKEVGSGFKRTSLNENFIDIEDAINNDLLWRDGSQPMAGSLDMDSERIINLPDAVTDQEPITLGQANKLVSFLPDQEGKAGKFLSTDGTEVLWKNAAASYANITEMFAGDNAVGEVYGAGGTSWRVDSISVPMTLANYTALSDINIAAFGALEDGSDSAVAVQEAVDYASPLRKKVVIDGVYRIGATINMRNRTFIDARSSGINVDTGIGSLFKATATVATGSLELITIEGGNWVENALDGNSKNANVTFFDAEGEYNGGSIIFVNRGGVYNASVRNFNQFMRSNWHRSWNVTNCFIRARNGFRLEHKPVETNVSNCIIFGNDTLDSSTVGFDVGVGIDAAATPGMYPEGLKINNCTIDQFHTAMHIHEILDLSVVDCWIGAGITDANLRWILKFEKNPNGNNFMTGLHFHDCTFSRARIEFVGTTTPIQTFLQMDNIQYLSAQTIVIGQRWYNIHMSNWILNSFSPKLAIQCVNENRECSFSNMRFKGQWSSLFNLGALCTGTIIDNCWSDDFIDNPYYSQTRVKITNSVAGKPNTGIVSNFGPIAYSEQLPAGTAGSTLLTTPDFTFQPGALVEVRIQGLVSTSVAGGYLEVTADTPANIESMQFGATWNSKYIKLPTAAGRIDATHIFRANTRATTAILINAENGDLSVDAHTYVTMRYI